MIAGWNTTWRNDSRLIIQCEEMIPGWKYNVKEWFQVEDDATITVVNENNGVAQKWVATLSWRDSTDFNENSYC